jgi:predicted unusual protein kinase regulating ubiquinone biosynthesis (AarF/ABC1/UbiB family)
MKISIFITFLFLLSSCSHQYPVHTDRKVASETINQLIDESILYVNSNLSDARKSEIKTFQENILKYLIASTEIENSEKVAIYNQATIYFNRVYPAIMQNIRNEKSGINQFVEIKSAPLWTLKDEIEYLNAEALKLPKPNIEIDLISGMKIVKPIYKAAAVNNKDKIQNVYDKSVQKIIGQDFDLAPTFSDLESLVQMNGSDEERIFKLVELVENKLKKHTQTIRHLGTYISKSGEVDLKNTQVRLVISFMDYYFEHMDSEVVKTIMSELVTAGPKLTQEETMKVIFKNTGPGLGKVLQQIGKEKGVGETFASMLEILESNGKKVPLHLVQRIVDQDEGGYEVKNIIDKPLGTGTMAQVNPSTIVDESVEVQTALRTKKPGIEGRCNQDIDILRKFVPDNEELLKKEGVLDIKVISTLVDTVERLLKEELDFNLAIENQKKAYEVYSKSIVLKSESKYSLLEIKVPKVYNPPHGSSNLHIQEFASGGVKFANLTDEGVKKIVAEEMVRMWFEEALFSSGFLNADLHQGNFRVVLLEDNQKIKIVLYDFGLSTTLTKDEQRAFLLVGAGAFMNSPSTIADGLMASMKSNDKNLRKKLINDIEQEMKLSPNLTPEDWVAWCVAKNYFVSEKLGALARGSVLLKQLPESIGQTEMFKDVIVKSAVSHLKQNFADRKYDFPMKKMDLVKIVAVQAKNSCIDMIKSFLNLFH